MAIALFGSFAVLVLLNVPISFSLILASFFALLVGGFPLTLLVQRTTTAVDSFVLLAVPFFILAGNLMAYGGISRRLVNLATATVGFIRGGLAHVNVVSSMFFAGITGAAVADTSAIGSILIPPMLESGYDRDFTTAVTAASSTIGVIIPPSIPMVIYGVVTGTSIGRLFLAGIVPGILIGLTQMGISYWVARKKGLGAMEPFTWRNFWSCLKESFLALMMPVIILGGILFGVVTPTEAAVLATLYALVVGLFVSKELKWGDLPGILVESATTTAVTMFMIAGAFLYGWIVTREQVPARVAEALASFSNNPTVILMLFCVIYLFAGTILDLGANIIIFVPVLYPITKMAGIDPVHFGVVTVVALAIGLITPPVGACLFVACEISGSSLVEASRAMLPFIVALVLILLLITLFPEG